MKEGVTESNVGDSGSGGGGSRRDNGWQKSGSRLGVVVNTSIALGALAVAVIGYLFTQSADFMKRRFARRIAKSQVYPKAKKGFPPLLPRQEVVDRIKERLADDPDSDKSIIIVGPRGVGKSTAAKMALKNRSHVVCASFFGDIPSFIRSVFDEIDITEIPATTDLISNFKSVLRHVKRKHNIMPKIVVEVDIRCTPEQMQELLLQIKTWGYERHLAQFIVVVSQSRILPELSISTDDLRFVCIAVGDLSKDETKVHLQEGFKLLKNMNGASFEESEVKELVEFTEKIIGRRLMHMDDLFEKLVKSRWSVEQIKDVAKFQVQQKISKCGNSLHKFKSNLRGKCETVLLEELLLKLTSESIHVNHLADCLGIDRDILLAADSTTNMAHHVLYIDPITSEVCLSSEFMLQAVLQSANPDKSK